VVTYINIRKTKRKIREREGGREREKYNLWDRIDFLISRRESEAVIDG